MKEVKFNEENMRKAYNKADKSMREVLDTMSGGILSKNLLERVFDFEAVCAEKGEDINKYILPADATPKQIARNAQDMLEFVYEVFNEGEVMDYENPKQRKFYPYLEWVPGSGFRLNVVGYGNTLSNVGVRLTAKSDAIVRHICKYFMYLYNEAYPAIPFSLTNKK